VVIIIPQDYRNQIPYFKSGRFYFDSSSTTLLTSDVINSVKTFYEEIGVRKSTGVYPSSFKSLRIVEESKIHFSKIFKVPIENIAFPANISLSIFYSLSLLYGINKDSCIVYTNDLSNDILLPIRNYIKLNNVKAIQLDIGSSSEVWWDLLEEFNNNDEIILILPIYSLIGEFYDKSSFIKKLRQKFSLKIVLDAVLAGALDLSNPLFDDADISIFDSNIGWGGPIGQSILVLKDAYHPFPLIIQGSGTVKNVGIASFSSLDSIESFETGLNPSVIQGLNTSLEFHKYLYGKMFNEVINLTELFRKRMTELEEVVLSNKIKDESRTPVTSFLITNLNSHEAAVYLDESYQIDIRSGYFCSHQLVNHLTQEHETDGMLQVSFHYYNTPVDIERIFEALKNCIKTFSI
jgi:selenocysteine lyase/cysteine desulfurase